MNRHLFPFWTFVLFPLLACTQTEAQIDSVEQLLETTTEQERIFELSSLLWSAYIDQDIDLALSYADSIIRVGQKLRLDTILSNGYQKKGVCYAYLNKFDSSGVYFRKAIQLYRQVDDYEAIASTQRNLGRDYNMIGQLDSASYYYRKARENFTKINDSIGIADIYNSEAIVYYMKGYYNLAFDKAVKGEEIFACYAKQHADLNQNRLVIASIYSAMKDTLNAITYFQKTIDYFKERGMRRQYASNAILLSDLLIPTYRSHPTLPALVAETAEDKTWEVFKSYFAEVHNDFDQNLKALAADITENDIRLASFLRMNLTTKEIASLLNLLPDSVLKSKYQLKKKLQLSKEQDLSTDLNTL